MHSLFGVLLPPLLHGRFAFLASCSAATEPTEDARPGYLTQSCCWVSARSCSFRWPMHQAASSWEYNGNLA
jgi:hypothetical protein